MDNDNFTLHVRNFADRVRAMNQQRSPELKLTAVEANNLLADIAQISALNVQLSNKTQDSGQQPVEVVMDGGSFK